MTEERILEFDKDGFQHIANEVGRRVFEFMGETAEELLRERDMPPGTAMDVEPVIAGVIGGIANFMHASGVTPEIIREQVVGHLEAILPQVATQQAIEAAGATQGGNA